SIPAANLKALLVSVDAAYSLSVWLDRLRHRGDHAETLMSGSICAEDVLWIAELHIGTPNRLKLKGKMRHLVRVATLLTTILGAPIAATEAYKNFAEAQKNFAEEHKLRAEEAVHNLTVIE